METLVLLIGKGANLDARNKDGSNHLHRLTKDRPRYTGNPLPPPNYYSTVEFLSTRLVKWATCHSATRLVCKRMVSPLIRLSSCCGSMKERKRRPTSTTTGSTRSESKGIQAVLLCVLYQTCISQHFVSFFHSHLRANCIEQD
jgi:hypothetical protein